MISTFTPTQKGIFFGLVGFCAFVGSDSASKWLTQHYSVMQVIAWEYLFALLFCLILSPFLGGLRSTLRTRKKKLHLYRGLANIGLALCVVTAFENLPLTSVYPVLFLSPFIMAVLAGYCFKEDVTRMDWVVIALGFSGVLIAFRPGIEIIDPWLWAAFATVFFISWFGLLARPLGDSETILSFALYPALANVVVLSPYFLQGLPAPAHLGIFIFSGLCALLGMCFVAHAYRSARYAIISPLQYLQLVLAFVVGYYIFGERPDFWMICGSAVIMLSGLLLTYTHTRKKP